MFLALILGGGVFALIAWLVFTFSVYALPFFVGLTAARLAFATGAGFLGAAAVGLVAGGGQLRPRPVRLHLRAVYDGAAGRRRPLLLAGRDRGLWIDLWRDATLHRVRGMAAGVRRRGWTSDRRNLLWTPRRLLPAPGGTGCLGNLTR